MKSSAHLLRQLLNSALHISQVRNEHFEAGYSAKPQVVPTCRFILITGGEVEYTVEQHTSRLKAGTAVFVPPWVWRTWTVPRRLDLLWVVFQAGPGISKDLVGDIEVKPAQFAWLVSRMESLFQLWSHKEEPTAVFEAELKAILARFFCDPQVDAAMARMTESYAATYHASVLQAMVWLRAHYAESNALAVMQAQVALHPDYFRDLFHQQVHQTPNQYLTQLRLRAARHFLSESAISIKEVATKTGFADPQYFTRAYRKFWGYPPSKERQRLE
ncbi:MAG: helix-turn-helix domain-containing protein [Candidatus Competibacteraceae bacterium]|nr:helix-turn-helix domain-containing protein [Candidatus Competibacteraceae bacterium]